MANTEFFDNYLRLCTIVFICLVHAVVSQSLVHFEQSFQDGISVAHHQVFRRDAPGSDEKCETEKQKLIGLLTTTKIDDEHTFQNETKYAMALAWAGQNDGTLIIVTSETSLGGIVTASTVYRSKDFGRTYHMLDDQVKTPIKKHNGVQRNPFDAKKVYLIGVDQKLYVTEDGGINFDQITLPFTIYDEIIFHSDHKYNNYLLAQNLAKDLYVSFNNGHTWKKTLSKSGKVYWGVSDKNISQCDTEDTIYATTTPDIFLSAFSLAIFTLKKSTDGGTHWTTIIDNVVSYERQGNFLYASVVVDPKDPVSNRLLRISTDCGVTWHDAQLPTVEHDRFYSVMDIESNMIFMHVDDPTDSGHGTLYTSASQGIVYSESLPRHLYPNYGDIHDFYKVKSIRGVYITSQMNADDSIHSVISYNRGATWQKIKRPDGVACKDETKDCYLQIHGMYSIKRGINTSPPISEKNATGLIMVHGNVADALQKTQPDVFVSSDGGYNWRLSLKGPHHYQIGDHGGLLVAVNKSDPLPKIIKFSTDEGRCWHEYTFTNKSLKFTGLLTEPEGMSLVVMIWGYISETRKWEVHIIDFKDVIKRQCSKDDYESWLAHQSYSGNSLHNIGCLLGMKETFLRLKKDSFCFNGYNHEKEVKREICECTREDYECDYGYYRPGGSDQCVEMQDFHSAEIDICLRGHEEKLVSEGYRKIPGDKCKGGFTPVSRVIDLNKVCDEAGNPMPQEKTEVVTMSRGVKIFAVIIVVLVMALAAVMGVYFMRKYVLLRKHRVEYRYSMLNQGEEQHGGDNRDWSDDLDNVLSSSSINYQDSDEELTTSTIQPSKSRQSQPPRQNGTVKPKDTNPFGSYHDDSDDDLLS